jgi:hypothetical protein
VGHRAHRDAGHLVAEPVVHLPVDPLQRERRRVRRHPGRRGQQVPHRAGRRPEEAQGPRHGEHGHELPRVRGRPDVHHHRAAPGPRGVPAPRRRRDRRRDARLRSPVPGRAGTSRTSARGSPAMRTAPGASRSRERPAASTPSTASTRASGSACASRSRTPPASRTTARRSAR